MFVASPSDLFNKVTHFHSFQFYAAFSLCLVESSKEFLKRRRRCAEQLYSVKSNILYVKLKLAGRKSACMFEPIYPSSSKMLPASTSCFM